jgi:Transposase DDE domain
VQNKQRRGGSAFDGRTTRHSGYAISQRKRKRIEKCFGWLNTVALMRNVGHRGVGKVQWIFTLACAAYNLVACITWQRFKRRKRGSTCVSQSMKVEAKMLSDSVQH